MFIGSYCAIGFGFMAATGGFALIAPLLGEINKELGPLENISWVAWVYFLTQAVFFLIVGRLSDVFGRRWFFIVGSIFGLIGSIMGATAQSINSYRCRGLLRTRCFLSNQFLLGRRRDRAYEVSIHR